MHMESGYDVFFLDQKVSSLQASYSRDALSNNRRSATVSATVSSKNRPSAQGGHHNLDDEESYGQCGLLSSHQQHHQWPNNGGAQVHAQSSSQDSPLVWITMATYGDMSISIFY